MFSRKGFTILELLIVIAVIAILIGIALPRFKGMQDEGNIAKAKGELRMLQTAVESYYIHNNALPASLTVLQTAVPQIAPSTIPSDPFGTDYTLVKSDDGASFIIYSVGPAPTGAASFADDGTVTDTGNCIYVTNASPTDTTP